MLIGYARTSTLEQEAGLEAQREALTAVGCESIWEEQVSSVARREALSGALGFCREGDVLVVTKLDRLARSVRHLGTLVETLDSRGVGLRVLDLALYSHNATGKLMLNVLGSANAALVASECCRKRARRQSIPAGTPTPLECLTMG